MNVRGVAGCGEMRRGWGGGTMGERGRELASDEDMRARGWGAEWWFMRAAPREQHLARCADVRALHRARH